MRENREKHQNYKIGVSPRDVINGYNEDETGDIPDQPFRTKQSADDDHTKFPTIKTSIPELASLILFTGRGDRVVIKLDKEHPEVIIAATSIGLDDDSLVLCMNAQGGYTPLALAKMNPNISFLMHEDNLLLRELAIRNIRTNYSINNALILSDEVYKEISTSESFSAVVYEPKSHHSMDLITSQFVRAHESLKIGGRLFVITHTKRGASQHMKLMQSVFGTEAFIESRGKGGFRVISISKNTSEAMYKPSVRGEVEFNIGGKNYRLETESSLFSAEGVDIGSRYLLEYVLGSSTEFDHLLDIGCGWGVIGLVAADQDIAKEVSLVDIDRRAIDVTADNIRHLQLEERVSAYHTAKVDSIPAQVDGVMTNPPFHKSYDELLDMFQRTRRVMKKGATGYAAIEATYLQKFFDILKDVFGSVVEVDSRILDEKRQIRFSIVKFKR